MTRYSPARPDPLRDHRQPDPAGPAPADPTLHLRPHAIEVPTIYFIDDDDGVRQSLRWWFEALDLRVATFAAAQTFLDAADFDGPGCVILDLCLPGMDGLELLQTLHHALVFWPVIMISGYGDIPLAVRAMQLGAVDFLQKPVNHQQLLERVRQALVQEWHYREVFGNPRATAARIKRLTQQEHQVLERIIRGEVTKTIARELALSARTVETHRANLMHKLGVRSIVDLVRLTLPLRHRPL